MTSHSQLNINQNLIKQIISRLIDVDGTVSVAESCTGGFVSTCLISNRGASKYFKGSVIAYNNDIKENFLDIPSHDISSHGVVSKYIAELMANNIRKKYQTTFGLATTGYLDVQFDEEKKFANLNAWVAVSAQNLIKSEQISLNKNRLENIFLVGDTALNLFRKHIV